MIWEICRSPKWKLYAKGGAYRKWYNNIEHLVDWSDYARGFYKKNGGLLKEEFVKNEGITWTFATSYKASFRKKDTGIVFSSVSPAIFNKDFVLQEEAIGFLNSKVSEYLLNVLDPTMANNVGEILSLPIIDKENDKSTQLTLDNISFSKSDWDSFETSWDFKRHPLV